jgi:hypothetical protein
MRGRSTSRGRDGCWSALRATISLTPESPLKKPRGGRPSANTATMTAMRLQSCRSERKARTPCTVHRGRYYLPRFGLVVFLVFLIVFAVVVFALAVVLVVIEVVVIVVVEGVGFFGAHGRQAVPAVGLAFSRFGGGYVDQKCRPHFGHTQN